MFVAPLTVRRPGPRQAPLTLAWPHYIVLCASLCAVLFVTSIVGKQAIYEFVYRDLVREFERPYGFEVGALSFRPGERNLGRWGIARVTPGGFLDRAGLKSGDYVIGRHNSWPELYGALAEAREGKPSCFVVINIADVQADTFTNRIICLNGTFDDWQRAQAR